MTSALLSSFSAQISHENNEIVQVGKNNCVFYLFNPGSSFPIKIMYQTKCFISLSKPSPRLPSIQRLYVLAASPRSLCLCCVQVLHISHNRPVHRHYLWHRLPHDVALLLCVSFSFVFYLKVCS